MRHFVSGIVLALSVAVIGHPAVAQGEQQRFVIRHNVTQEGATGIASVTCTVLSSSTNSTRVVEECSSSGQSELGAILLRGQEREALQLSIPGYAPGDGERHIYVLTFFTDTGVGNTNLYPDESGSAQVSLPSHMFAQGEPAMVISQVHVETGEMLFSMDIEHVLARSFVSALHNARMNLEGDLSRLQGRPFGRSFRQGVPPRNDLVLEDRRVSLFGENLTLDETLDMLFDASGCSVFLEGSFLFARSCR